MAVRLRNDASLLRDALVDVRLERGVIEVLQRNVPSDGEFRRVTALVTLEHDLRLVREYAHLSVR